MKKLLMAVCAAALTLGAVADKACEEKCDKAAPCPEKQMQRQRMQRQGMNRPRPARLTINEKTTPADIEAFKKEVCSKIDEAAKAYAAKEGDKKAPTSLFLVVNDRSMRPRGMGPRGKGMRGMGPRGKGKRGPKGEGAPAKPEEAK